MSWHLLLIVFFRWGSASSGALTALLQQLIKVVSQHVHIHLVVEDQGLFPEQPNYFSMLGIDPSRVMVNILKPADFWFRDSGPLFLVNHWKKKAIADFNFSNYHNTGLISRNRNETKNKLFKDTHLPHPNRSSPCCATRKVLERREYLNSHLPTSSLRSIGIRNRKMTKV